MLAALVGLFPVVTPAGSADADPGDAPTWPRCFISAGSSADPVTLDVENVDARRIVVRANGRRVARLAGSVTTWTDPTGTLRSFDDITITLRPDRRRIRCVRDGVFRRLRLGDDHRACEIAVGALPFVRLWGDFGRSAHLRSELGWIGNMTDRWTLASDRVLEPGVFVRVRGAGIDGFVDVPCEAEIDSIRFERGIGSYELVGTPTTDNGDFTLRQDRETLLITNQRTGDVRTYVFPSDNKPVHISEDGNVVHWWREFDPDQPEAADLTTFRVGGSCNDSGCGSQPPTPTPPARAS